MGHISPEAYEGGPLALVEDGDPVRIDIPARELELLVPPEVLARRREAWQRPEKDIPDGYLSTYRKNSLSAAQGAVVQ